MKFAVVQEISPEIINRIGILNRVSDFLDDQFSKRDYGIVEKMIVGINCIDPKLSGGSKDFETGLVIYKKYTKAKKFLDFKIKLNYSETVRASENEVIDIFAKGLLKSYSEIAGLDIKDFDIAQFYSDLKEFLHDRAWLNEPYQEKFFTTKTISRDEQNFHKMKRCL